MIKRDYNHPSIFSWVIFNETWGLYSKTGEDDQGKPKRAYLPETQEWVVSMYNMAKSLDKSRLVEDNSICCGRGHTETDIYSWHVYLPGWKWDNYLKNLTDNNFPGSSFDFEEGYFQGNQPNVNSECGNVWGYSGSTGDVDWSWDYHRMINTFRKYHKVGGWLYTEHHDVINEWNGYWRFDRTEKETGLGEIMEGMSLKDLHSEVYLSTGNEICKTAEGGSIAKIPLFISATSKWNHGKEIILESELWHTNFMGETKKMNNYRLEIPYEPFMQKELTPLSINIPKIAGISTLKFKLTSQFGEELQRNFMQFEVLGETNLPNTQIISQPANAFVDAKWSKKQWAVLDGKKVNGAGKGYFDYAFDIPEDLMIESPKSVDFYIEISAKELFVKDIQSYNRNQDFMKGSRVSPSSNPNSYPMTDETKFPSKVNIYLNHQPIKSVLLEDDPADHRGVLSWHHQLKDGKLREAGSYGYLIKIPIKLTDLKKAMSSGEPVTIRLATEEEGGIAVYGKEFGRYMLDPSIVIRY